jgi:hypothetical protein
MGTSAAGKQPLSALTTRDLDDPAIAMLDAWAVALDVLSFYQERIANEGYLRTSTERRSIVELARAIGYELRPGLAASPGSLTSATARSETCQTPTWSCAARFLSASTLALTRPG